jgi:S1-C subfamily serine protease
MMNQKRIVTLHDVAILKIKSGNYHTLSLGDYEKIKEGNEIYFCGYPLLSWHHAINHGMVSALFTHDSIKIIQIDGSINSGNLSNFWMRLVCSLIPY